MNLETKNIEVVNHLGADKQDTILALSWLKTKPGFFLSGSSTGRVCCASIDRRNEIVREYPKFERLTSVHSNCDNSVLLLSGYATDVSMYDIETASLIRTYQGIHNDHINISRFTNHSPHIFGTSSFDGSIKLWDTRQKNVNVYNNQQSNLDNLGQIYTIRCKSGVVMINFSLDDTFILASAQDNEITQYTALDGKQYSQFSVKNTGLKGNFTRAYYTASGRYTITGACEQNNVKILCTYTGHYLSSVSLTSVMKDPSLYVQSLRGSPNDDFRFCVLTSYRDIPLRELVLLTADTHHDEQATYLPGIELSAKQTNEENNLLSDSVRTAYVSLPSDQYLNDMYALRLAAHKASFYSDDDYALGHVHRGLVWIANDISSEDVRYMAVHGFVLKARLPLMLQHIITHPHYPDKLVLDVKYLLPLDHWSIYMLLIDFLYTGLSALELWAFRRTALSCVQPEVLSELLALYRTISPRSNNKNEDSDDQMIDTAAEYMERGQQEAMLMAMSFNDSFWTASSAAIHALLSTIFSMHQVGVVFGLREVSQHAEWLLFTALGPKTAYCIYQWAVQCGSEQLAQESLSYIARRIDVVQLEDGLPLCEAVAMPSHSMLSEKIKHMQLSQEVEVVSQPRFLAHLESLNEWLEAANVTTDHADRKYVMQMESAWHAEEAPFVRGVGSHPPVMQLSTQYYHQSCLMQDKSILFLGGMNKERMFGMSRMLVYDLYENRFRHVEGRGREVPASAYMHIIAPLEKHKTRHLALFGGKVKRGEVVKHVVPNDRNVVWESLPQPAIPVMEPPIISPVLESTSGHQPLQNSIYEFDYLNLTWVHKPVKIVMTEQITRFAHNDDSDSYRAVSQAFNGRIAQAAATVYMEDVPYRCSDCLFTKDNDVISKFKCEHRNSLPATYCVQYSGYCVVKERIVNDLHVLKCTPAVQGYAYEWMKVKANGTMPRGRFSHAMVFIPKGGNMFARMIVHCGVMSQHVEDQARESVASLRINVARDAHDLTWELVTHSGESPGILSGHTLTHVAPHNTCVIIGGVQALRQGEVASDTIWCMRFHEEDPDSNCRLHITWSKLQFTGPGPSTRSRLTVNFQTMNVSGNPLSTLFVFGGMDETLLQPENGSRSRKGRDAVIHRLVYRESDVSSWREMDSTILWSFSEPLVKDSLCSLGLDMLKLVCLGDKEQSENKGLQSDLLFSLSLPESISPQFLHVFATLVAVRCPMINALLSTGMQEAQTGIINIYEAPSLTAFMRLQQYIAADFAKLETIDDAVQMLELGNLYSLSDLIKLCEGSLLRLVNADTVCELLCYAENYHLELLRATCYSLLLRSGPEILGKVLSDPQEDVKEGMDVSGSDSSEDTRKVVGEEYSEQSYTLPSEVRLAFAAFAKDSLHIYKNDLPSASDAL
ncbi:hypothetical protein EON65_01440 [archaeon]|nr:MAG: hypothetical protein EON65_01440 [archaeon]